MMARRWAHEQRPPSAAAEDRNSWIGG